MGEEPIQLCHMKSIVTFLGLPKSSSTSILNSLYPIYTPCDIVRQVIMD